MRIPTAPLRSTLASRPIICHAGPSVRRWKSTSPVVDLPKDIAPQITTLPNRIRVISEPAPGHIHTIGVTVEAGTRFESKRNSGVTHLLDKLSYSSNAKYSAEEMLLNTSKLGSALYTLGARDTFFYSCTSFPHQSQLAMSVLANNISSPLFLPSEVESAKSAALYETQVMWASAKQVLPEVVIQNAFKDNTLGHPSYLTEEQSPKVGELELRGFMKDWFKPERTIVTGLGMPHEELVELVQEHFEAYGSGSSASASVASSRAGGSSSSLWGKGYATVSNVELPSDFVELSGARARYTGGEMLIEKEDEEYTHLAVAFEAPSVNDPDVYATAVMHQLLLGGTSFSQGGPGKGMFSRLVTNVMNRNHWVDLCQSFHEVFNDTGLFGIRMAVEPRMVGRATAIMAGQLHALTGDMMAGVTNEQLMRAKNMLKSFLVMGTEARMVAVEDLSRQFLTQGYKESTSEMCAKVDRVTKADIHRVASRIFRPETRTTPMNGGIGSGEPTIVAIGKNAGAMSDARAVLKKWGLGGSAR